MAPDIDNKNKNPSTLQTNTQSSTLSPNIPSQSVTHGSCRIFKDIDTSLNESDHSALPLRPRRRRLTSGSTTGPRVCCLSFSPPTSLTRSSTIETNNGENSQPSTQQLESLEVLFNSSSAEADNPFLDFSSSLNPLTLSPSKCNKTNSLHYSFSYSQTPDTEQGCNLEQKSNVESFPSDEFGNARNDSPFQCSTNTDDDPTAQLILDEPPPIASGGDATEQWEEYIDQNRKDYVEPLLWPRNIRIWEFIWMELTRSYSLQNEHDRYTEKRRKVYAFLRIPIELEKFLLFGFLQCLDAFCHMFTFLPLRILVNLVGCCIRLKPSGWTAADTCDLLKALIIVICSATLIQFVDTSIIYHLVRGQGVIKLYIFYNMLEVADKLFSSFGQDVFDALLWTASELEVRNSPGKKRRLLSALFHLIVAVVYALCHTVLVLLQATTLNVAFNSHNQSLLTIMMSNNFVELKGSVFKKFAKPNLFQMSCSDVRERFHTIILLTIVVIRNMTAVHWKLEHLHEMFPDLVLIIVAELIVDWLKHAFITKFNEIPALVYRDFTITLAFDVLRSHHHYQRHRLYGETGIDGSISDFSDQVSRRMGFIPIPITILLIGVITQSVDFCSGTDSPSSDVFTQTQTATAQSMDESSLSASPSSLNVSNIPSGITSLIGLVIPSFDFLSINSLPAAFTVLALVWVLLFVIKVFCGVTLHAHAVNKVLEYRQLQQAEADASVAEAAAAAATAQAAAEDEDDGADDEEVFEEYEDEFEYDKENQKIYDCCENLKHQQQETKLPLNGFTERNEESGEQQTKKRRRRRRYNQNCPKRQRFISQSVPASPRLSLYDFTDVLTQAGTSTRKTSLIFKGLDPLLFGGPSPSPSSSSLLTSNNTSIISKRKNERNLKASKINDDSCVGGGITDRIPAATIQCSKSSEKMTTMDYTDDSPFFMAEQNMKTSVNFVVSKKKGKKESNTHSCVTKNRIE